MTTERATEIEANLARAAESLEAAGELLENEHWDFAASRAYYAAFHASTALVLSANEEFGKHSGVIAAVHRLYVKTQKLDKRHGRALNWLFELRGVADYGETRHVPEEQARESLEKARDYVQAVRGILGYTQPQSC